MREFLTVVGAKAGINVVGQLDVLNGTLSVRRTDLVGPATVEMTSFDGFVTSTGSIVLNAGTFGSEMVLDPGLHGDSFVRVAKKLVVTGELVASSSLGVTGNTTLSGDLGLLGSVNTDLRVHKTNPVLTLSFGSGISLREATIAFTEVAFQPRLTISPGVLGAMHVVGSLVVSGGVYEGGDRIADSGNNADGYYVRFSNGLQVCWQTGLTASFASTRSMSASWTYPAAFTAAPTLVPPTMPSSGGAYTGINLNTIGNPFIVSSPGSSSASILVWSNTASYVAGNSVTFSTVAAIGRWK